MRERRAEKDRQPGRIDNLNIRKNSITKVTVKDDLFIVSHLLHLSSRCKNFVLFFVLQKLYEPKGAYLGQEELSINRKRACSWLFF